MALQKFYLQCQKLTQLLLIFSIWLAKSTQGYMVDGDPNKRADFLDPEGNYHLQWKTNWETRRITFNVTVKTRGWILFGLANDDQQSTGKDIVIGGVGQDGRSYLSDRHEESNGGQVAITDESQDYTLEFAWRTKRGETFLSFSRALDTCDSEDYPITENKATIIWAYGDSDNYDTSRGRATRQQRGSYQIYLLEPEYTPRIIRDAAGNPTLVGGAVNGTNESLRRWTISVHTDVPPADTTYRCTIHKAPRLQREHHIIGFDVHLADAQTIEHVHHFTMFKCNVPRSYSARNLFERFVDGASSEPCFFPARTPRGQNRIPSHFCTEYFTIWAIGGRAFFLPPQAGIPLGEDTDEYYLLSTHYDNPQHKLNREMSVRMDVWYTPQLRANDASAMSIGTLLGPLPPTMLIPPHSTNHRVVGHCGSDCTRRIFPEEGITVFASLLHSHNSGIRTRLRHFDMEKNAELPWVLYDDNYSNRFQQIRHLREEVKFLPGDHFTAECTYDNTWTNGTVVGGFSTSQEMCSAIVYYYNKINDYSICSAQIVNAEARRHFLGGLENVTFVDERVDWVATSPRRLAGLTVTEISDRLPWTRRQREELQRFHEVTPVVNSCSRELFLRNSESLRQTIEERANLPLADPPIFEDTEDDYSSLVKYPFDAEPYVPPTTKCANIPTGWSSPAN